MTPENKKELIKLLSSYVTDARLAKMHNVLSRRTRYLTLVMEDIYQAQNASAVLRSCECFGVQDVHIIENRNVYQVNPDVALGANKWLSIHKYNKADHNTLDCLTSLKHKGYKLIATTPHKNDCLLEELPLDKKTALLFGTELKGLSEEAISMADGFMKISMAGFTESFNSSVSAAICLYHLAPRIRKEVINWQLTEEERTDILIEWLMGSVNNSEGLIRHFKNSER